MADKNAIVDQSGGRQSGTDSGRTGQSGQDSQRSNMGNTEQNESRQEDSSEMDRNVSGSDMESDADLDSDMNTGEERSSSSGQTGRAGDI
jgi:hypothetical protein